jgi:hypothetical protein
LIKDEKIFIYIRLRDDKKIILKSRIREFAAIGKLLMDLSMILLKNMAISIS